MRLIGWIRIGDKAACGATVLTGNSTTNSHGRALAHVGSRMACRKNCVIIQGHPFVTFDGKQTPHHGHLTSGGCPLISTLNDIHGWGAAEGEEIPVRFVQDEEGVWVGKMNEGYDQHFLLADEATGSPLVNRYYRMSCNGRIIEGKTDSDGKTEKVVSDDPVEVTIEIMPEGYAGGGR